MTAYLRRQEARNQQSRDGWRRFSSHRSKVMSLLRSAASPDSRLGLLGAGNSNDVDLNELNGLYRSIDLIDLDPAALREGLAQQQLNDDPRVNTHALDLAAGLGSLGPGEVEKLDARLSLIPAWTGEPFEVAASLCLLSQLIDSAVWLAGKDRRLDEIVLAVRNQHLRTLVSWLKPDGVGILITDFVSSETCEELPNLSDEELPAAARRWLADRNFFSGINPGILRSQLAATEGVWSESIQLAKPWKWDLGPRVYAVTAIIFRVLPSHR